MCDVERDAKCDVERDRHFHPRHSFMVFTVASDSLFYANAVGCNNHSGNPSKDEGGRGGGGVGGPGTLASFFSGQMAAYI